MKYKKIIIIAFIIFIITGFLMYRIGLFNHVNSGENVIMLNNKEVYVYIPEREKNEKLPMVFVLHGRNGEYENVIYGSGWDKVAKKEKFVLIGPNYNANGDVYEEIDSLIKIVKYAIKNFNIDSTRVYASGFSNGGAASIGLCQDYPEYFAAIAPMGWMKGMSNKNNNYEKYDMPFQIIKGDKEYTYETSSGKTAISVYEEDALKSLFQFNNMPEGNMNPDYEKKEYWGYQSRDNNFLQANDKNWYVDNFYKEGFSNPFGQLILMEDQGHRTNDYEATLAWNFLKNFARTEDGNVIEINNNGKENDDIVNIN